MGKSADTPDSVTVSYYVYYAGWQAVPCQSAGNATLMRMLVNDREVFSGGQEGSGTITIDDPEAFGGREREGGVVGQFDFLDGSSGQGVNQYLQSKQTSPVPAYRGVVSIVARRPELQSNNPFLKPWKFQLACMHGTWYEETREIYTTQEYEVETRVSTSDDSAGDQLGDYLGSIGMTEQDAERARTSCHWGHYVAGICDLPTDEDAGRKDAWFWELGEGYPASPPADNRHQWEQRLVYVPDGGYELQWLYVGDSNAGNNVPTYVTVTETKTRQLLIGENPAHIVEAVLTNSIWGKGLSTTVLDLDSFTAAADTLYAEEFGLSLTWTRQTSIDGFLGLIMDHINGVLTRRPDTGQYRLTLLRSGQAPTFNILPEHVVRFELFEEAGWASAVNEITVRYIDIIDGKTKSVTVHDLAAIQRMNGIVNSDTRDYLGLPTIELAEKVARRDLATGSVPIKRVRIVTDRRTAGLAPGDVFSVAWPDYGLNGQSFRLVEIDYGLQDSNEVSLVGVSDIYLAAGPGYLADPSGPEAARTTPPVAAFPQQLLECPYWMVSQFQSSTGFPEVITDQDAYVTLRGSSPQANATNFRTNFQLAPGGEIEQGSNGAWAGSATLAHDLTDQDTELVLDRSYAKNLGKFTAGTLAIINGTELVEIVGLDLTYWRMTVNRGMLDTLPTPHPAVVHIDTLKVADLGISYRSWNYGELAQGWVLTSTPAGTLQRESTQKLSTTVVSRMVKPLPPGNLRVNDVYLQQIITGELKLQWAHRNRLTQTTNSFITQSDGNVQPEDGTTYRLEIYDEDDVLIKDLTLEGYYPGFDALEAYEQDVTASVTINNPVLLSTVPGGAQTSAGADLGTPTSATDSTVITASIRRTGTHYPSANVPHLGIAPTGFTRSPSYGHPSQRFCVSFGDTSVAWTKIGAILDSNAPDTVAQALAVDTWYDIIFELDWAGGTYDIKVDTVSVKTGTIPAGADAYKDDFQFVAYLPNYNSSQTLEVRDIVVTCDGATILDFSGGGGTLVLEDEYTYPLAEEITDSGRENSRLRVKLWPERDSFASSSIWDREIFRAAEIQLASTPNSDLSAGDLTNWTVLLGAPVARALADLGWSGCGASLYAMGNSGGDYSDPWAAYYELDLLSLASAANIDAGKVVLQIALQHRAEAAGVSGDINVLFLDVSDVSIGQETSELITFQLGVWGQTTLIAPVTELARKAQIVVSASGTSSDNRGYVGCMTVNVLGRLS